MKRMCYRCNSFHEPGDCGIAPPATPRSVAPTVIGDIAPYRSPLGTGWVTSRSQRREEMAASNMREVDPSEKPTPRRLPEADPTGVDFQRRSVRKS